MSRVGEALKRKLGPLPVWAWALIGGIALYWYRSRKAAGTVSGTGTGSVAPAPATPQDVSTLQPGESAYDPNTGALVTAPGGDGGGMSNFPATDFTDAINALAAAVADATQAQSTGNTTSSPPGGTNSKTPPQHRTSKLTAAQSKRGDIALPFGSRKPRTHIPKGYREVGTGKGNWVLQPIKTAKRAAKSKTSGRKKNPARPPSTSKGKSRPRLGATMRFGNGGRTGGRFSTSETRSVKTRARGQATPSPTKNHNRNTHPAVSPPRQQQHTAATHPKAKPQVATVQQRPSAPPRSAPRTKQVQKPPPPSRKRTK